MYKHWQHLLRGRERCSLKSMKKRDRMWFVVCLADVLIDAMLSLKIDIHRDIIWDQIPQGDTSWKESQLLTGRYFELRDVADKCNQLSVLADRSSTPSLISANPSSPGWGQFPHAPTEWQTASNNRISNNMKAPLNNKYELWGSSANLSQGMKW